MKKNKGLLSQAGFSMIEVIIAAGLTTVVALTISKLTQQSNRNIKKLETNVQALDFEGWIKSRLRNDDTCKRAFNSSNLIAGTETNTDYKPPNGTTATPFQALTTLEIKRDNTATADPNDEIIEQTLTAQKPSDSTYDIKTDFIPGFPSWSLREIRIYNQTKATGGIGGKCDLMFRIHRLKGGTKAVKRSAGREEKIIWLDIDCNTEIAPGVPGRLIYCAESSQVTGGPWERINISDPREGIKYTTGAKVQIEYDLEVNGILTVADGPVWPSDKRFKKNIKEMSNVSDKLRQIKAYNYVYRIEEFPFKRFSNKVQNGFMAQEVLEIFPNTVNLDKDEMYNVNYVMFVPLLVQAHKEQEKVIKDQQNKIDQLERKIDLLFKRVKKIEKGD